MVESPPGLILDDLYRVLADRDPETVRLVVEAVEPHPSILHIRYALVDAGGGAVRDATGAPIVLVGGVDPEPPQPGLQPGAAFAVPPKRAIGSNLD